MTFYIRNYTSEEKFDLAKFMQYENNVFDVLSSPFLTQLKQLQTVKYYNVNDGYRDIDLIAADVYGDSFYSYLIQFYNSDFRSTFPENTKLNLFSLDELNDLYLKLSNAQNLETGEN